MSLHQRWTTYPSTYCAREMTILAGWILSGKSGAVVGLGGVGKSNLLGFLCHRPDVLKRYLPDTAVSPILIDLNDLPTFDPSTLYRHILRSFYEARHRLTSPFAEAITAAYQTANATSDPFIAQSAVRELLFLFQTHTARVVLVLDRFDLFCQNASPLMADSLRGLRDSFRSTLCYIVAMRQEISYLADPATLGELYELLDTHICRVRPLVAEDAQHLVRRELAQAAVQPNEAVVHHLIALTGGYPSLLKAACHWWTVAPGQPEDVGAELLLVERAIRHRLEELWLGLSQEEQLTLLTWQRGQARTANGRIPPKEITQLNERYQNTLLRLVDKGLLKQGEQGWHIFSELFSLYLTTIAGLSRGKIWHDRAAGQLYQGQMVLENLTPLERVLLIFLLDHPQIRHSYTAVIEAVWPVEVVKAGVSNEALFQVVTGLRRKIEPNPAQPCYLINWRGSPEGGYQCFPDGRPQ